MSSDSQASWLRPQTLPSPLWLLLLCPSLERKETNMPKGKDLCMWQMAMAFERTPC